jgi:peptidyl-prolyl cis-trans isomerase C
MPVKRIPRVGAFFILFIALTLVAAGCGNKAEGNHRETQSSAQVLATVGDMAITVDDLEAAMGNMPERKRVQLRDRILDSLIENRVFAIEAARAGLDQEPRVKEGVERVTDETLAFYFVKKRVDPEAEPSEKQLREFYEENKDQFIVPDGVRLQEIVVKDEQTAMGILQSLKDGASFETVAKEASIVGTARDGGNAGWKFKGHMDPELEKVVFSLEPGVLSDVIKTRKGNYQIVKVLEKEGERQLTFEDTQEKIRDRLFWKNRRELMETYYQTAGVERNPSEPGALVKIGDEVIPEAAIELKLAKASDKDRKKIRARWIDYFIETRVFSKEAKKVELQNDPEVATDIQRKTDSVLAKAFHGRFVANKTRVTDSDIAEYYKSNPDLFKKPVKVRVKSILVKTREEAEEVLREVNDGAAFGYLAQKKSLHPHAEERAGEIGWFAKGEKDPALEKVAFSLKKEEVSGVIQTADGYEVIKLMDRKGGGLRPLEEVKPAIQMTLSMQKLEKEKQLYYKKARVNVVGS